MTIKCARCNNRFRLQYGHPKHATKPIIAVAGVACETSNFTPARTDFAAFHPVRGDAIFKEYPFLREGQPLGDQAEWRCAVTARAIPGGIVLRDAFERLADEIIARLQQILADELIDGLWFDVHGAMTVDGLDDSEAELLKGIRRVIGPDVVVSTSMDLHGNVSRDLVELTDLITCYRSAPHEDVFETNERACSNLLSVLRRRQQVRGRKEHFEFP